MLLFLENASSLMEAIETIKQYGKIWDKSVRIMMDGQSSMGVIWGVSLVSSPIFKYLGITISTELTNYETLNLGPIFSKCKQKLDIWRKVPLSVVGRPNLLKNDMDATAVVHCL